MMTAVLGPAIVIAIMVGNLLSTVTAVILLAALGGACLVMAGDRPAKGFLIVAIIFLIFATMMFNNWI